MTLSAAVVSVTCLDHGVNHAIERQIGQRVARNVLIDLIEIVARCDELRTRWRIDAVIAGPLIRRTRNAHMNLARTGRPEHLDNLTTCRAAHDTVVHHDDSLAGQDRRHRRQFQL